MDFVLIGMEASTGGSGKKSVEKEKEEPTQPNGQIARNFAWSTEDFILHHCIRKISVPSR